MGAGEAEERLLQPTAWHRSSGMGARRGSSGGGAASPHTRRGCREVQHGSEQSAGMGRKTAARRQAAATDQAGTGAGGGAVVCYRLKKITAHERRRVRGSAVLRAAVAGNYGART